MQGVVLCMKKLHFFVVTDVRKISSVAYGFSSIKIHNSVNRINEVYVLSTEYFFNKINKVMFFQ